MGHAAPPVLVGTGGVLAVGGLLKSMVGVMTRSSRSGLKPLSPQVGALNLKGSGGQTFEIVDGVRWSKAAELSKHKTIQAEILQGDKFVGTKTIPINSLRSPNKSTIDISNNFKSDRLFDTLNKAQSGSKAPPITVRPGSNGVKVSDIELDPIGL